MSNVSQEEYTKAAQIVLAQYKHTTPTGTPSTPYYTGPSGLFGVYEVPERDVFSTRVQAQGMISVVPWRPSNAMNPLFPYLTGFQDAAGTNPSTECGTAKTPGAGKSCYQTAQFGLYQYDTREMTINRQGQHISNETFDMRLVNDPLGRELASSLFGNLPPADALVNGQEMLARMIEVGERYQLDLMRQFYTGNPANSLGTGYLEFPGADILIGTTKVDAKTNTDCPSLDSLIRNANYANITSLSTFDVVKEVTYIARILKDNAERMGYLPATWAISMRRGLFYELTALWPCSYWTYGCQFRATDGTVVQNVSSEAQITFRDQMRAGRYLLIDGEQWPVVLDDGIVEESSADTNQISTTCFASDVYFHPMTVLGSQAVTYIEYYNYNNGPIQAAQQGHYINDFWTDGGKFMWVKKPPVRWCVQLGSKIQPRLIYKAPFLAARLQNVQYCPLIHERDANNADDYFVNGGVSTPRAAPSYYSDWNT